MGEVIVDRKLFVISDFPNKRKIIIHEKYGKRSIKLELYWGIVGLETA